MLTKSPALGYLQILEMKALKDLSRKHVLQVVQSCRDGNDTKESVQLALCAHRSLQMAAELVRCTYVESLHQGRSKSRAGSNRVSTNSSARVREEIGFLVSENLDLSCWSKTNQTFIDQRIVKNVNEIKIMKTFIQKKKKPLSNSRACADGHLVIGEPSPMGTSL